FSLCVAQSGFVPGLGVSAYTFPFFRTWSGTAGLFDSLPFSIGVRQFFYFFYIGPLIAAAAVSGTFTFFCTGGLFVCSPLFAEIMIQRGDLTGFLITTGACPGLYTRFCTGRFLLYLPLTKTVLMFSGKDKIYAGFFCIAVGGGAFFTKDGDILIKGTGFNTCYGGRNGDF